MFFVAFKAKDERDSWVFQVGFHQAQMMGQSKANKGWWVQ
jgi:hypothetical protein